MRRIKTFKIAAAAAALLCALPAQANLVINGGFETGALPPWIPTPTAAIASGAGVPHSGTYAASLGPTRGSITEATTPFGAGSYYFSFWAKDDGGTTAQALAVSVNGDLVDSIDPTTSYSVHSYTLTLAAGGTVAFEWLDGSNHAFVDDVNLIPVPEPTTMIAGALLLLLPFGASTLRFVRKSRAA